MARKARADAGKRRKSERERKSVVLTVRVDAHTKKDLDRARVTNNRTLGQEIQHRLSESMSSQKALFGDERTFRLGQVIAECARFVQLNTGLHWRDDPWTFAAFAICVGQVLDSLRPAGEMQQPSRIGATVAGLKAQGASEHIQGLFADPEILGIHTSAKVKLGLVAAGLDFNDDQMNLLPRAGYVLGVNGREGLS